MMQSATSGWSERETALKALIDDGLTFSEAALVFHRMQGEEEQAYIDMAAEHRLIEDGVLEVDPTAMVSMGTGGAYVQVWLYVSDDDNDEAS